MDGKTLFDHVDYSHYWEQISEDVKPWSYMKFPFLRALGPETAGTASARWRGWRNATSSRRRWPTTNARNSWPSTPAAPTGATLGYHWARMIEMLHAAEAIKELLHDDDLQGDDLVVTGERQERGVGMIEAPRGTLIHHYRVDENDQVIRANLIVSTTHNNQAMNEAVRQVARQYLDGRKLTEGLLNHIEVAVRAFDPCLSCATHALGKMPLQVELIDAEGKQIDQLVRGVCDAATNLLLSAPPPILIIGIGNPSRGDDALGPLLIERLEALHIARRRVAHRLPVAGRIRAGFAGPATGDLRRCQPRRRRAVHLLARCRRRRHQLQQPRPLARPRCCMPTGNCSANRRRRMSWRYAAKRLNWAKA